MRTILVSLLLAACLPTAAHADEAAGVAVVELFTSEGCSSCPAAEALLNKLDLEARRSGTPVYALAFHVDYWNYLGWQDRFSSKRYADRQRRYAKLLAADRVYTPQMVVNGRAAFVGSSAARAHNAISAALSEAAPATVFLHVKRRGGGASVTVRTEGAGPGSQVQVALVVNDVSSDVTSGENRGRRLVHRGVVRDLRTLAAGTGTGTVTFELPNDVSRAQVEVVAFVRHPASLAVLGAARSGV